MPTKIPSRNSTALLGKLILKINKLFTFVYSQLEFSSGNFSDNFITCPSFKSKYNKIAKHTPKIREGSKRSRPTDDDASASTSKKAKTTIVKTVCIIIDINSSNNPQWKTDLLHGSILFKGRDKKY